AMAAQILNGFCRTLRTLPDLPAGGSRLLQHVDGYTATIKAGAISYRDGIPTGELRGKLLRRS
ncbi:hypothetical protein, partial [Sphingopyxis sp.]|uniref:hypothetical protein n=1 Tax=Sphingopyxis sp. TaxID=1908224 RepID=UPI0025F60968